MGEGSHTSECTICRGEEVKEEEEEAKGKT
jgi:hypothetical protein